MEVRLPTAKLPFGFEESLYAYYEGMTDTANVYSTQFTHAHSHGPTVIFNNHRRTQECPYCRVKQEVDYRDMRCVACGGML